MSEHPLLFTIKYFSPSRYEITLLFTYFTLSSLCQYFFKSFKHFRIWEYWSDICMQIWITITCASLPLFQAKPWLYFLLLQAIRDMLVYRINPNHYLARWKSWITGFQSRGVGLNFGWILRSPWELKNHPVSGPHPRKIKWELPGWGPRHHSLFKLPKWFHCSQHWNAWI